MNDTPVTDDFIATCEHLNEDAKVIALAAGCKTLSYRFEKEATQLRTILRDIISFCDGPLGCIYSSQNPITRAREAIKP